MDKKRSHHSPTLIKVKLKSNFETSSKIFSDKKNDKYKLFAEIQGQFLQHFIYFVIYKWAQ